MFSAQTLRCPRGMRVRDGSPKGGDAFSRLRALHDSPPAPLRAGTPVPIPLRYPDASLVGLGKFGARFLRRGRMASRPEPLSDNLDLDN